MESEKMKCIKCRKVLAPHNKTGYCTKCYYKSPQYLEYQRIKQKEFYYKHKDRKKAYYQRPEVKKRNKKYMKKYNQEHKDKMRIQKREWARKNKTKIKARRGKVRK